MNKKVQISDIEYEIIVSSLLYLAELKPMNYEYRLYEIYCSMKNHYIKFIDCNDILDALALSKMFINDDPNVLRHLKFRYDQYILSHHLDSVIYKLRLMTNQHE